MTGLEEEERYYTSPHKPAAPSHKRLNYLVNILQNKFLNKVIKRPIRPSGSQRPFTMAAKRVTRSAIDWTALATKVPSRQKDAFRVLKSHSDKYITKVADLPETLPKIDFGEYRRRITNTAIVEEYEKLYAALDVPYPKDPSNQKAKIQSDEKVALQQKDAYVAQQNLHLKGLNELLATIESIPPPEKMTMQMYNHYFPDSAVNPNRENPGFFPMEMNSVQHDHPDFGPEYLNTYKNMRGFETIKEWEEIWRLKVEHQKAEKAKQLAEKKSKESKEAKS
ncbi:ATP synthase subunit d, mitochondrial-like [Mercenaria mercenaria]|uniref:ATP synthase subunit d, mitochondrial-like n=1 Tax=Mercenaria mercenaria TaxID=6596 RepID=UPI00234F75A1|nr:ATP synthase subunit d, mitochondrial-like [Mercenaria mercenaria]